MPVSPSSHDRPVAALWHRPGEHGVIIRTPLIGSLAQAVIGGYATTSALVMQAFLCGEGRSSEPWFLADGVGI
jgi:hypothetical protein